MGHLIEQKLQSIPESLLPEAEREELLDVIKVQGIQGPTHQKLVHYLRLGQGDIQRRKQPADALGAYLDAQLANMQDSVQESEEDDEITNEALRSMRGELKACFAAENELREYAAKEAQKESMDEHDQIMANLMRGKSQKTQPFPSN